MSLPHSSIATIDSPEFINLQPLDISPNMSKCDIKVFYLGKNRNGSFIGKEVAANMAKTLRGAPIVGYYKPEKDDFSDHAEQITLDDEGIHFKSLTFPYGFVAPDAQVWFQKFDEQDDFGNPVVREYLMTTGYLWTGVYPEAGVVFRDGGKPQSMELDEETIDGHWATDYNDNVEFFIINDAIISKLCILGDSVEPCFEGASVTESKEVKTSYTLDDTFKKTLFDMMKELEFALKGGNFTVNNDNAETKVTPVEEQAAIEPSFEESPVVEAPQVEEPIVDEFSEDSQDNPVQENFEENQDSIENPSNSSDFAQDDKEDDEKDEDPEDEPNPEDDDDKKPETKNSLHTDEEYAELEGKYNELEGKYNLLTQEIDELRNFKLSIENQQKDELIASFTMLSEEDKKDVIENKLNYSLDDIKAKLAVICFDKKVNFVENAPQEEKPEGIVTYNLEHQDDSTVPDWVKVVEETQKRI